MSWIKRALGLEAPLPDRRQPRRSFATLGLALGRTLCLDSRLSRTLGGASTLMLPGNEQVRATGRIDLGQGTVLERFYFDDEDYFLQRVDHGDGSEDVILFGYHQVTPVTSRDDLQRLTGPQSKVGQPFFDLEGIEYQRQWGTEDGHSPLVPMQERVTTPQASYTIRHQSLLYARDIGLDERREFLLFSVEEDEQRTVLLSTAVGVTLHTQDITVL